MSKFAIFYNPLKSVAAKTALELQKALENKSHNVKVIETKRSSDDWGLLDGNEDLCVALGGDGTFLLSARQVINHSTPLLGINFGHLGFLSEYGDIEIDELAHEISNMNINIEERTILEALIPEQNIDTFAINDIAVNRSLSSNLLHTDLYIDDDLLHSYRSDAIVVSTPTGSTAYSLSAGGAVMDPNIHAFQIVPVAAHSLNSRAHVVSDSQTIVLQSKKEENAPFTMQPDGQELITVNPGAKIILKKAQNPLKLAKLKKRQRSFYSILRDKMKWGSSIN